MSKTEVVNETGTKVGDFFVSIWGYDQTNVDFYKVIAVTAKSARVQAWKSARVGTSEGYHDLVVPGDGPRTSTKCTLEGQAFYDADYWERQENSIEVEAPIKFHKITGEDRESAYFTLNSYSGAHFYDGAPRYETAAGFGH